ncbi:MAG: AraC family transcriptional regulator [Lachnospiraceae bacterium]|nr:AraC family transcriptional regulator [Robinsoniella sp.]MDY3767139.1 AraC family transcriptional regulator [Lachnospiraceae bacterium]
MTEIFKNSYIVPEKDLVSLSVYNVGYQKCESLYTWGPGIRNHYLIHYIISGKGYFKVNGSLYALKAGDCFLVYPNQEILYYADENDPWEYCWIGFSGSDAPSILGATDFSPESPVLFSCPFGDEIQKQFLYIYAIRGNDFKNAVEMTGKLYTALALFMKDTNQTKKRGTYDGYVQKSIEYISSHYSYPITVEDIAQYAGVSRSHLFRAFQSCLKQSPKEYLISFRIKQACLLLKTSDLSITSIANSVGFDNSLYFSKAFHKVKGMSPTQYQKKKLASK